MIYIPTSQKESLFFIQIFSAVNPLVDIYFFKESLSQNKGHIFYVSLEISFEKTVISVLHNLVRIFTLFVKVDITLYNNFT